MDAATRTLTTLALGLIAAPTVASQTVITDETGVAGQTALVSQTIAADQAMAAGQKIALRQAVAENQTADWPMYCGTERWQTFIAEAANRFPIPQAWVHAVMRVESAGCDMLNGRATTSSAGAMGLMQLMPATWAMYRDRLGLGKDPYDPHDNILAGVAYLRDLYATYGFPGLFAAYHAGGERLNDYLANGRPLPQATLDYLARLQPERLPNADESHADAQALLQSSRAVFVTRETASRRELFVVLSRRSDASQR
jgi:soluble lytic murein transglycosylase-like protein